MRTHMANMMREPADKALFRILNPMGYLDYVERSGLKNTKTEILQMLAQGERSPLALVERLDALAEILRNKEDDKEAKLVLSTIHSSKGLEYDTVYLLDVADGLFPETVLTSYRSADKEEIAAYEEERRLFYVGVTRAKENLILFQTVKSARFLHEHTPLNELLPSVNHRRKNPRAVFHTDHRSLQNHKAVRGPDRFPLHPVLLMNHAGEEETPVFRLFFSALFGDLWLKHPVAETADQNQGVFDIAVKLHLTGLGDVSGRRHFLILDHVATGALRHFVELILKVTKLRRPKAVGCARKEHDLVIERLARAPVMFTEAIQDGAADLALLRLPDIDRVLIGRFFFPEQKIDAAEGEFISVRVIIQP
mgnify:CR=1 FL=1